MNKTYLAHHGVKKQKWYVRRYQNPDGSLTPYGKQRRYRERYKRLIDGDLSSDNAAKKNELDWIATKAKYKQLQSSTKDPELLAQYEREFDKERLLYTKRTMTIRRRHDRQAQGIMDKILDNDEYRSSVSQLHDINQKISYINERDKNKVFGHRKANRELSKLKKEHFNISKDIGNHIVDGYSEVKIDYIDNDSWNRAMNLVDSYLEKY